MTTDVREAVRRLQEGEVVAFATETLWGLAADAFDEDAVRRIIALKQRPEGVPLALACHSWRAAQAYIRATPGADALAARFLPGPLSIVVPRRGDGLRHLAPDGDTLSIRVPAMDDALRILDAAGPLALTSANVHGAPDSRTTEDVRTAFPGIYVLDGSIGGRASTVVDATGPRPRVLREGVISQREVDAAWP